MPIAKTKQQCNYNIGSVGVLLNLNTATTFDVGSAKFDFDNPGTGWVFYGLTTQDSKIVTDTPMFEGKAGNPEVLIRRFFTGVEATISGTFEEIDRQIHDLIAGDGNVLNVGPVFAAAIAVDSVGAANHTVTFSGSDAADVLVNNSLVIDAAANLSTSQNVARVTSKDAADGGKVVVHFDEGWFTTDPVATDDAQQYTYLVSQLGAARSREVQLLLVYETEDGVQYLYHFPTVTFTPNVSPTFSSASEVAKIPWEAKAIAVVNSQHGDGTKNIVGYYYELVQRTAVT